MHEGFCFHGFSIMDYFFRNVIFTYCDIYCSVYRTLIFIIWSLSWPPLFKVWILLEVCYSQEMTMSVKPNLSPVICLSVSILPQSPFLISFVSFFFQFKLFNLSGFFFFFCISFSFILSLLVSIFNTLPSFFFLVFSVGALPIDDSQNTGALLLQLTAMLVEALHYCAVFSTYCTDTHT